MKALVFGSNGQVGRALTQIAHLNWVIDGLNRESCDLTDEKAVCQAVFDSDADIIVNAAAYTAVDNAENDASLAKIINSNAPGWMAKTCAQSGKRFLHISTDFVFGLGHDRPISAEANPDPLNIYGTTKLAGEQIVLAELPDALIVRTSWVYAATGANFLLTMLRLMTERDEIAIVADQTGTPTAARDLAQALLSLAAAGANGIHHFTNAGMASWYDFAVAISEEAVHSGLLLQAPVISPIATSDYPTTAIRPHYSVLDKSNTYAAIGAPARHWRSALREVMQEIKKDG